MWISRTESNCHGDIYQGNICLGDICPYQEYHSCQWPNFDDTFNVAYIEHLEQIPNIKLTFVLGAFLHIRNISAVTDPMLTKL